MAMRWEAERRLDYIDFRLVTAGSVRRADITRTFGVSVPQASSDLNEFRRRYPGRMVYDLSAKQYVAGHRLVTVRGNTPEVITLIRALAAARHPMGWK
jgi:hypothetical protein